MLEYLYKSVGGPKTRPVGLAEKNPASSVDRRHPALPFWWCKKTL